MKRNKLRSRNIAAAAFIFAVVALAFATTSKGFNIDEKDSSSNLEAEQAQGVDPNENKQLAEQKNFDTELTSGSKWIRVKASTLKVREEGNMNASVITLIPEGSEFKIIDEMDMEQSDIKNLDYQNSKIPDEPNAGNISSLEEAEFIKILLDPDSIDESFGYVKSEFVEIFLK